MCLLFSKVAADRSSVCSSSWRIVPSNDADLLIIFYEPVRINANEGKGQSGMPDSLLHLAVKLLFLLAHLSR